MTETSASMHMKQALIAKGYRRDTLTTYAPSVPGESRTFTVYVKTFATYTQVLLLEVIEDEASREELYCELYRPLADEKNLAATLAAIP